MKMLQPPNPPNENPGKGWQAETGANRNSDKIISIKDQRSFKGNSHLLESLNRLAEWNSLVKRFQEATMEGMSGSN